MAALLKEIDKVLRPFHQTDQPTTTSTDVQTTIRPKQDQPVVCAWNLVVECFYIYQDQSTGSFKTQEYIELSVHHI